MRACMNILNVHELFFLDNVALLMMGLILFIGACVAKFSYRYMQGDAQYSAFFIRLILLILMLMIMACANNLILFFISWCVNNLILVQLMIHNPRWRAAKSAGVFALRYYFIGAFSLAIAFILLYIFTGQMHFQSIFDTKLEPSLRFFVLVFLLITAMTQSAIFPFHKWLLSSLNSPTPVSAIMHAGLVNGGGFLLIRFSFLYYQHSYLLIILFFLGIITALLGTFLKLFQSDIKRMLACSTVSQMGYMFIQCGLGLFSAAMAHLMMHGMFKAYLFLNSGSAGQQISIKKSQSPTLFHLMFALGAGFLASLAFGFMSHNSWFQGDTTLILMIIAHITGAQFALSLLQKSRSISLFLILITTSLFGLIYGASVYLITKCMSATYFMQAQPLNFYYLFGVAFLLLPWFMMLFFSKNTLFFSKWKLKFYVMGLNASQPHASTVTAHRNHYY